MSQGISLQKKAETKLEINVALLGVTFTIFTLIFTLGSDIRLQEEILFELSIAIPFFLSAITAYSNVMSYERVTESGVQARNVQDNMMQRWRCLAWMSYATGFSFLVAVLGISIYVGFDRAILPAVLFYLITWVLGIIYGIIDVINDPKQLWKRLQKTSYFIILEFLFGMMIILNDYYAWT